MAESKLTDQTLLTAGNAAADDLVYIVDVSDNTGGAAGTSKKATISTLMGRAPVVSVNGETGAVSLDSTEIKRIGTTGDSIDTDLTAAETSINEIKAVLKYPLSTVTGLQVNSTNKLEIDSTNQKAVFTVNGSTAATIGPSQSLFPQVRIGTTGDTYDLPITRGTNNGEVPIYDSATNTSEWRTLGTSSLSGSSDGITEGTTNLFLTSAERTKLTSVTSGAAVASVSGTAPIVSSGGTTPAISITAATTSAAGSMSATDKTKLDGVTSFQTIAVATQSDVVAASTTDTLTLVAAGGMAITTNATTDTITFDSKYLDFDDVTLQGARLIEMNGETLRLQDSGQLHAVAEFTTDSVDLREVTIRAMDNGSAGYISLMEAVNNGTDGIRLQAPTNLAASTTYTLPTADGTSGQLLSTNGTGGLSWATASGGGGTSYSTVRTQSGTSYTLALTDAGDYIQTTSTTAVTITVPLQSSVTWAADTEIYFEQNNTGQITIAGASGVTVNSSETLKTAGRYSVIALKRVASDTWTLTGERQLA